MKDLVWSSVTDRREILGLIDGAGSFNSAATDVVDGPDAERIIEMVSEELENAAKGTSAGQQEAKHQTIQPFFQRFRVDL